MKKKDDFYKCAVYGWSKNNLCLSEKMFSHLKHRTGNDLSIIMGGLRYAIKHGELSELELKRVERALDRCKELADYFNNIEEFISAA